MKGNIMATITINYNARNRKALKLLEFLRSLDFIKIAEKPAPTKQKSGLELAYEDVAASRVHRANDGEDLIRQCLAD